MATRPVEKTERQVRMGIGEAVLRLVHVEMNFANGVSDVPQHLRDERDLIVQALDHYQLDLGFDCDEDGVVDVATDVNIFKQSAETSCCRILPKDTSRKGSGKTSKPREPTAKVSPTGKAVEPPVRVTPVPADLPFGGALEVPTPSLAAPAVLTPSLPATPPAPPTLNPAPDAPKAARGDLSRRKR